MLVAKVDDRIIGGALSLLVAATVKVDVIALEPDVRRKGMGRWLMERIEVEAIRLGARGTYIGGANAENRAFYWRLGFQGRKSLMQKGLPLRAQSRIESGGTGDESEHRSDV